MYRATLVILIGFPLSFGCSWIKSKPRFDALEQPVAYRSDLPGSAEVTILSDAESLGEVASQAEDVAEPPSRLATLVDGSKQVALTAGKFTISAAGWLGFHIGKSLVKGLLGVEDEEKTGFDPDPLWRQGYGFNNPNGERLREGLPPLNFDGSEAK